MQNVSVAQIKLTRVHQGNLLFADDELAVEEPLEIQLMYDNEGSRLKKNMAVTMRTPGNDAELATGFLFTEGIIQYNAQVANVASLPFETNKILITLADGELPKLEKTERNFYTTSSCGVCGKSGIDNIKTVSIYELQKDEIRLRPEIFYTLHQALRQRQDVFESTGGLHAAALFDLAGNFKLLREDVGRHNALDKIIGTAFLNNELPLNECILLLSGRASFELIQKAAMAGIKIIAAVGAPSSLAVQLAEEMQMTLIGFLKNERFNIYCGGERILVG
ncbi:MAG: formate dehydrogenase accessory sulfurtransferase FdhD [Ferruginibacter sp.]